MLQTLVTQGRSKLEKSKEDSQALESALSELQEQTDNAKGLITETFLSTLFMPGHGPSQRNHQEDQDQD